MTLDREEIERLYKKHGPMVYRRCRAILGDEEEARDAMQEVFIRLLKNIDAFRGEASPTTWLYRVGTNLCLNRIRDREARSRKLRVPDPSASSRPGMSSGVTYDPEHRALVLSLLNRADEETRRIVVYYFLDELTLDEIATLIQRSVPTVRKRIKNFRALAARHLRTDTGASLHMLMASMVLKLAFDGTVSAFWSRIT